MSEEDISVEKTIQEMTGRLEALVHAGHVTLVGAIRELATVQGSLNEYGLHMLGDDAQGQAERMVWEMLHVLEPVVTALEEAHRTSQESSARDEFEKRARLLAADTMQLGFDDNGHWEFDDIMRIQHDARRLLTGVDEGPYVPERETMRPS